MTDHGDLRERLIRIQKRDPFSRDERATIADAVDALAELAVDESNLVRQTNAIVGRAEAAEQQRDRLAEALGVCRKAILAWEFCSKLGGKRDREIADALFAASDQARAALANPQEESDGEGFIGPAGCYCYWIDEHEMGEWNPACPIHTRPRRAEHRHPEDGVAKSLSGPPPTDNESDLRVSVDVVLEGHDPNCECIDCQDHTGEPGIDTFGVKCRCACSQCGPGVGHNRLCPCHL